MARKFIKRFVPDPDWVKKQRSLKFMGSLLHEPNLWHLTRHSVSVAAFIGFFVAFIPLPGQMIIAAGLAILLRANLAASITLVWVTNPFTMPPIFYLAYNVGHGVMGSNASEAFEFHLSWDWIVAGLSANWQPFILGCLLCGLFFGLLATTIVRLAWRWHTIKRWHERKDQRLQRKAK
mgnify:CR=1 FL=1